MRRTCLVILSWVVLLTAIAGTGLASEVTALKIRHKVFDAKTHQLSYELWNDSEQTITAWRLSLARSDPHGHAQNSVLDQDFFDRPSLVIALSRSGPIHPGASIEGQWRLEIGGEDDGPVALSVEVVAAVFDDLSWEGDPIAAETILEARAVRVREMGEVVRALEEQDRHPRSRQAWSSDLAEQAEKLRLEGEDPDFLPDRRREVASQLSAIKLELAQWLEQASREVLMAPNPGESLRVLTQDLKGRYEVGLRSIPEAQRERKTDLRKNGGER